MLDQTHTVQDKAQDAVAGAATQLLPYPIDMSSCSALSEYIPNAAGVSAHEMPVGYHPTAIARYALAHWNKYLATGVENHRKTFLTQAVWLVEHEVRIGDDAGGWPASLPHHNAHRKGPWLSALIQGNALSVLIRAYRLTQKEVFLEVAQRTVRTFERDILDGGVRAPICEDGIFFEEIAIYPASHRLSGFIFALIGLYDYATSTNDDLIQGLIQHSLETMHDLLGEFDTGFWTRADLLQRKLATSGQLDLQIKLLEALAAYSGCEHCVALASYWKGYQTSLGCRLRYLITSQYAALGSRLLNRMRSLLFPKGQASAALRVCVPITGFPITGGTRAVLDKIAQVTSDIWQIEYLTHRIGPESEGLVIHRFGMARASSWLYTTVWLYCFAGLFKLISLIRHGANYHLILPQDGVFTAAFSALAAKLAGIRVVCIDHGNLTLLKSRIYHHERTQAITTRSGPSSLPARLFSIGYWPSLDLLARFAARFVDHYLIPGVRGDGVEEICEKIGISPGHITRFANVIDLDRHVMPDAALGAEIREKKGIPIDAIVITMICRLVPAKGIDIALESISRALSVLSPEARTRVRLIIAGDGPLRREVEEDIDKRSLNQTCMLWGEASQEEVISLLGITDIFLYTSRRGTGYPMAILEAMASACAVVASAEPLANAHMLAEQRGIVVPVGDIERTSTALKTLVDDSELRHRMGRLARDYVALMHNATVLRRALMRITYWAALDEFLHVGTESQG